MKTIEVTYKERGVSLVELMVAMTIGLVLMLVVATLFFAQKRTFRMQDDQSRLQETSRAALDVLGYHIRLAGFVDISDDPARVKILVDPSSQRWLKKTDASHTQDMLSKFFAADAQYTGIKALMGCDGAFDSVTSVALPWGCAAAAGPDSITVAYQAQPTESGGTAVRPANTYQDTLGAYNAATGQGGDCGAQDVNGAAAAPKGPLAINRFYVDTATKRLMCVGNGDPTKPRPIAEGVEDMRITYGIIPDVVIAYGYGGGTKAAAPRDAFVGRYVKAADVTDWSGVLAVHVCLQIASPTPKIAGATSSYKDCNNVAKTNADGKIRQTFNATFTMRNNVLTAPDALP